MMSLLRLYSPRAIYSSLYNIVWRNAFSAIKNFSTSPVIDHSREGSVLYYKCDIEQSITVYDVNNFDIQGRIFCRNIRKRRYLTYTNIS